jgi:ferredoxin-NADP reductase
MAGAALPGRLSWRLAEVVDSYEETPRARSIAFDVPGWGGHRPGQHVDVRLTAEDGYQAERSYSIASAPEHDRMVLTVERLPDGEVSPFLCDELQIGDRLELRGPIGGYFAWDVAVGGPLLLIAGGSGIVPLMAMIRHRAANGSTALTRLLYSSRTWADVIYRDELAQLASRDPLLEVFHTLTRGVPDGWTGFARRIDREMLAQVAWLPAERPHVFICGPTALVESAANLLASQGHDPTRIKTERFGPTGA